MGGLRKRHVIGGAAAALIVAAGCMPVKPAPPPSLATQVCGMSYASASAYQNAFSASTHGNTGWITAGRLRPGAAARRDHGLVDV